jgi:hypothetical protein
MNSHVAYTTKAMMPLRNEYPSFGTPIYTVAPDSGYYIQSYNKKDIVTEFNSFSINEDLCLVRGSEERIVRSGDGAIFAFYSQNSGVILGDRKELIKKLNEEYSSLSDFPFVQLQVAKFINNNRLIRECEKRTRKILEENDPQSYTMIRDSAIRLIGNLQKIELKNFPVYRLVRKPMPSFPFDLEVDELEGSEFYFSALNRLQSRPLDIKHPFGVTNMFRHIQFTATRFSERYTTAAECGLSVNSCIQELKEFYHQFFDARDIPSSEIFIVQKIFISGEFYDARHIDIGDSRINREICQCAGSLIAQLHGLGVLFNVSQSSEGSICLFSPACISRTESLGEVIINFDDVIGAS